MTEFTHIRESTEDTERHLSENREKYESDGLYLYRLMKMGKRLTRQQVVKDYGINDRRLGEIFSDGKCQKEWVVNENGKRLYVQYFIPIPKPITKGKLIALYQPELF